MTHEEVHYTLKTKQNKKNSMIFLICTDRKPGNMCGNECEECGIIEAETLDQTKLINRLHQAEILYLML